MAIGPNGVKLAQVNEELNGAVDGLKRQILDCESTFTDVQAQLAGALDECKVSDTYVQTMFLCTHVEKVLKEKLRIGRSTAEDQQKVRFI